jgi:Fic family protein
MEHNRFNKRIKISPEVLAKIARIDEFKGLWRGSINLNPAILKRLKQTVVITSTGASTRIEGSKMSDEEVARLLRGLKTTPPKNRDEQEVAGYADLIGRVFDNYKDLKLTENNILHFHGILLNYSDKDQPHKGKYKADNNVVATHNEKGESVILFKATPPYLVRPEMEAALDWTVSELDKKELHPILIVANFIFEFLAIHPFSDGNGRLSRALTNLLLLRADYAYVPYVSIDEIIEDTRSEYYIALNATQNKHKTENEDITPWLNYVLDTLLTHVEKARKLMQGKHPEMLLSESQEQVLAFFKTDEALSISDIGEKLHDYARRETTKKILARLVELRLIELIGRGRGARYKKVAN